MHRRSTYRLLPTVVALVAAGITTAPAAQTGPPAPAGGPVHPASAVTFRTTVDLVSVSAVVRDKRGRVISSLAQEDFEILDEGTRPPVLQFHSDATAPASIAILVDGSGSMALSAARDQALQISTALLDQLIPGRDAAALLSFDTRLLTLCDFTGDFDRIRARFGAVEAYGSTSLYDAIAGAAAVVADRVRNRRAVIVMTDGADTASSYSALEVSSIASTIDVPVYVFGVGTKVAAQAPHHTHDRWASLAQLARATGGDLFILQSAAGLEAAIARVTDELRHQYLLAFEPAAGAGLRRLEVRTRQKDLRVTARAWYQPPAQ